MIVCYMGKLPWYFDYFAHSCGFNLYIDFYIITDDKSYKKSVIKHLIDSGLLKAKAQLSIVILEFLL